MLCVLWLGSSVGNLKPHEAVGFFQSMQSSAGVNTQVPYLEFVGNCICSNYTACWPYPKLTYLA